jgi:drug/metabolite transporter (DMT)-like permease
VLLAVIGLTLTAAVLHATWNAVLKGASNTLVFSARAVSGSALALTPLVAIAWLALGRPVPPPGFWGLVVLSGVLEVVYFVFLSWAYGRGELSVVYPIARGTAPVLATAIGLVILGERVGGVQLAGIACLLAGIWAVRRPVQAGRALLPALLTGVTIAAYSAVDRVGVRLGPPWLYLWALWVVCGLGLMPIALLRVGGRGLMRSSEWWRAALMGVLITATYLLVLLAYRLAPLSIVAPLRESAVVLVAGWGVFRLREREGARLKLAGAAAIVAGVALIAIG